MKNIIIVGPSRAGKSTLARRIHEELGHFVIGLDALAAVFWGAYPQLGVRLNGDRRRTTENLAPFLGHLLGALAGREGVVNDLNLRAHAVPGNRFVLEGAYFDFDGVFPILRAYGIEDWREAFVGIGLVQNRKTAQGFFEDFRRYDTPQDWTHALGDEDLREVSAEAVTFSRTMTAALERQGFAIYDTSAERERVLDAAMADVRAAVGG